MQHDSLFPEIEPYRTFRLPVSDKHELCVEEVGNPEGPAFIFFHGGPGGGLTPFYRRFFDPAFWRVVLFDQRGSGSSTPLGELDGNTTWDLVADTEKIRRHLGIESWFVFGGSWGSTLGLAYAESHPDRVRGLILRGIYMARRRETLWTFGGGVERIYPDGWAQFIAPLSDEERKDVLGAYHQRLTSGDPILERKAALAWNDWEENTSSLVPEPEAVAEEKIAPAIALARIEAHYFIHNGFFEPEDQLLRDIHRIRHLPAVIVQGRYDMVCPCTTAWELHQAWPEARFQIVPGAGHASSEPGITAALLDATEDFKAIV